VHNHFHAGISPGEELLGGPIRALSRRGRFECRKDFLFGSTWQGEAYPNKRVRPIFVSGVREIVVVTVYVYYF
jgi:hypothetical protein